MHPTGFEPVTFQRKTDYESGAFNHSATNAYLLDYDFIYCHPLEGKTN